MCLFPRLILNPKYKKNKKNKGRVPFMSDSRVRYVPVGCGQCLECRKQLASEWRIRLYEELRVYNGLFVTFTIDADSCQKLVDEVGDDANAVACRAVRLFCERYRKFRKVSVRHWLITEKGHTNTERVHLHGIIFFDRNTDRDFIIELIQKFWSFGFTFIGDYCNEKSINYMTKYVTKIDSDHKGFVGQIFCSPGIGSSYLTEYRKSFHQFKGKETKDYYVNSKGYKLALPIYYRNKLYNEHQREILWINRLDLDTRYVLGQKISGFEENQNEYFDILKSAQELNRACGFGDCSDEWKKRTYTAQILDLQEKL